MFSLPKGNVKWISSDNNRLIDVVSTFYMRMKLGRALSFIDIHLPFDGDYTTYCGEASAIITMSIEMDAGVDCDSRSRNEVMNSMFFMIIICRKLSHDFGVSFEKSSLIGGIEFVEFDDQLHNYLSKSQALFENISRNKDVINSIENVFSIWVADPTRDCYETLVDMYKSTAQFVRF